MKPFLNMAWAAGAALFIIGFWYDAAPHDTWARGVMILGAVLFMGAGHILDRKRR